MKIIHNGWIPFRGYKALNLFGIVFVRGEESLTAHEVRHEMIHTAQMQEMLYVGFYLWYAVEWVIRLFQTYGSFRLAYRAVSLEREAYAHEGEYDYLTEQRRPFAWTEFLTGKGGVR